jgi:hypothetical protein
MVVIQLVRKLKLAVNFTLKPKILMSRRDVKLASNQKNETLGSLVLK